ncbi:hypothetical protein [Amycolatopsis sp. NPDC051071]|uniref:hypothetical protein n=1 Tax=Amycolatopsis sp. NPDC051071 TaxID=3154637 RepID=UPI0034314C8B
MDADMLVVHKVLPLVDLWPKSCSAPGAISGTDWQAMVAVKRYHWESGERTKYGAIVYLTADEQPPTPEAVCKALIDQTGFANWKANVCGSGWIGTAA